MQLFKKLQYFKIDGTCCTYLYAYCNSIQVVVKSNNGFGSMFVMMKHISTDKDIIHFTLQILNNPSCYIIIY